MTPEFSFILRAHDIGGLPRLHQLAANPDQCAALAQRFGLLSLDRLEAELTTRRDGKGVIVTGTVTAAGQQACVISAEPVAFALHETVDLRFAALAEPTPEAEIELTEPDLETLPLDDDRLDLGEVVAQSLGLGLDPYPRAPAAVRAAAQQFIIDEEAARMASNPFSILKR